MFSPGAFQTSRIPHFAAHPLLPRANLLEDTIAWQEDLNLLAANGVEIPGRRYLPIQSYFSLTRIEEQIRCFC